MTVEKPWKLAKPRLAFILQPNIRLVHCLGRGPLITPNIWGMSRKKGLNVREPRKRFAPGFFAHPELKAEEGDSELEEVLLSSAPEGLPQPSHPHHTFLGLLRRRLRHRSSR
jgi:hypothetical protein